MKFMALAMVALCGWLLAGPAAADTAWTVGFKGGLALANLTGDDMESGETDFRTGFVGGAFAQVDLSKNFGIRLEGLYHMQGASGDTLNIDGSVNLDYIEFPLLLVGQIPASEKATVNAFAGPVLAFNTKAEVEISAGGVSGALDIKDDVSSIDFALAFGLGASFEAGSVIITVDGRYQMGLQTIDDGLATSLGEPEDFDIKNQGWAFMAGVGFPIGGQSP
jgi:hypothetical protein